MQIYVVAKMVDSVTDPSSETVGAYIDKSRADAAAKAIAGRMLVNDTLQSITYGVVETVELDLGGIDDTHAGQLSKAEQDNIMAAIMVARRNR